MAQLGYMSGTAPEDTEKRDFPVIPAGEYPMRVVNSEVRQSGPNAKYPGVDYVVLEMEVTDGPSAGRKHWENFNLFSPDAQTKGIAQRAIDQLCAAIGKIGASDTEDLHMHQFIGKIGVKPGSNGYGPKNNILAYKSATGAAPAAAGNGNAAGGSGATTSTATPPSGGSSTPPWKR